jgi:DNA-binding LacI/PurR family transcriptional regulator/DNA-binding transcriptional regulator YhcF (GntR family)
MTIDRTRKQPVFKQIYNILLAELDTGCYKESGMLPSEKELCGRFNVERNTVRKALRILVDEERVVRVPGLGTRILFNQEGPHTPPEAGKIVVLITQKDYLLSGDGESFHYKLIHTIEKRLSDQGYHLVFKTVGKNGAVTETIRGISPSGIIFDSFNQDAYYQEAAQSGLPCVSINHYTPLMTSIVSNNFDGAYKVAERLINAGHRRIAFILGKRSHQTTIERLSGIQSLYMSRDIPLKEEDLIGGNWLFSSGIEAGERILAMDSAERPTAIFAFNDDMAYGCFNTLQRGGLSVPDDISIVGFDKSDRYSAMFPPISTLDVNLDAIVDYACWYLADSLAGKPPKARAKIQIDTTFCDNGTIKNIL